MSIVSQAKNRSKIYSAGMNTELLEEAIDDARRKFVENYRVYKTLTKQGHDVPAANCLKASAEWSQIFLGMKELSREMDGKS